MSEKSIDIVFDAAPSVPTMTEMEALAERKLPDGWVVYQHGDGLLLCASRKTVGKIDSMMNRIAWLNSEREQRL